MPDDPNALHPLIPAGEPNADVLVQEAFPLINAWFDRNGRPSFVDLAPIDKDPEGWGELVEIVVRASNVGAYHSGDDFRKGLYELDFAGKSVLNKAMSVLRLDNEYACSKRDILRSERACIALAKLLRLGANSEPTILNSYINGHQQSRLLMSVGNMLSLALSCNHEVGTVKQVLDKLGEPNSLYRDFNGEFILLRNCFVGLDKSNLATRLTIDRQNPSDRRIMTWLFGGPEGRRLAAIAYTLESGVDHIESFSADFQSASEVRSEQKACELKFEKHPDKVARKATQQGFGSDISLIWGQPIAVRRVISATIEWLEGNRTVEIPDPFSDQPIILKEKNEALFVYSRGLNGKDDGGPLDSKSDDIGLAIDLKKHRSN